MRQTVKMGVFMFYLERTHVVVRVYIHTSLCHSSKTYFRPCNSSLFHWQPMVDAGLTLHLATGTRARASALQLSPKQRRRPIRVTEIEMCTISHDRPNTSRNNETER